MMKAYPTAPHPQVDELERLSAADSGMSKSRTDNTSGHLFRLSRKSYAFT
jgi:hypothetical protein